MGKYLGVGLLILCMPLLVQAEHATITLNVYRTDPDTGKPREEAKAAADSEPPAGGSLKRPMLKVKANEPLTLQFVFLNTYPHGITKNVTIRFFVAREEKAGQKKLPDLKSGVVVQGQFELNFKPKGRVSARVAFKVPDPGVYLVRVDSLNTQSDHEHFSALDLQVD